MRVAKWSCVSISRAIANLCAQRLDRRISGLAARFGATYSRYADDLVISGDRRLRNDVRTFMGWLAAIVEDEGFVLNPAKTRVMTANQRQHVGGCVINAHPAVPRAERDRLEAILISCLRDGPEVANREDHPDFRGYLRGRIEWVAAANPRHASPLRERFDAVAWQDPPIAG